MQRTPYEGTCSPRHAPFLCRSARPRPLWPARGLRLARHPTRISCEASSRRTGASREHGNALRRPPLLNAPNPPRQPPPAPAAARHAPPRAPALSFFAGGGGRRSSPGACLSRTTGRRARQPLSPRSATARRAVLVVSRSVPWGGSSLPHLQPRPFYVLPLYVLFLPTNCSFYHTLFVVSFDKKKQRRTQTAWRKQCACGTTGRCVSCESSRVAQAPLPLARAPLATLAPPCLPPAQSPSSPPFALLSGSCTSASCPSACPPPAPAQVVPISALTIDETLCGGDEIYRCSPPPP